MRNRLNKNELNDKNFEGIIWTFVFICIFAKTIGGIVSSLLTITKNTRIMLNIKRLSIEPVWELPKDRCFEGVLLDDNSAKILYQMESTMDCLEVMGIDNQRSLWLDFQGPEDFEEYPEDFDSNGVAWYEVTTSQYNGIHYLSIGNGQYKLLRFMDKKKSEFDKKLPQDISKPLAQIADYLATMVDKIIENPDAYNDYVSEHLPYNRRNGIISRRQLNRILPVYKLVDNPGPEIRLLEEMDSKELSNPEKLTINTYAHYWRIGYEAFAKAFSKSADYSGMSDMEMFTRYSNQGRNVKGYDLDSEKGFAEWDKEYYPFHNKEIVYARVFLTPEKDQQGRYYFELGTNSYNNIEDVLAIAHGYQDAGINVSVEPREEILAILRETDKVGITPHDSRYMGSDGVGNEISLPYPDESITQDQIDRLIKAVDWEPIQNVEPKSREAMEIMTSEEFCENMDAMVEKAFNGEKVIISHEGQLFAIEPIRDEK